jgi:hypothetical protein
MDLATAILDGPVPDVKHLNALEVVTVMGTGYVTERTTILLYVCLVKQAILAMIVVPDATTEQ